MTRARAAARAAGRMPVIGVVALFCAASSEHGGNILLGRVARFLRVGERFLGCFEARLQFAGPRFRRVGALVGTRFRSDGLGGAIYLHL